MPDLPGAGTTQFHSVHGHHAQARARQSAQGDALAGQTLHLEQDGVAITVSFLSWDILRSLLLSTFVPLLINPQ